MEDWNRILAWHPDEYSDAFRQGLMMRTEEKANEAKKSHQEPVAGSQKSLISDPHVTTLAGSECARNK